MTQPLARRGAHWLGDATLVPLRVLFLVMAAGWIAGAAAQTGAGDGPAVRQEHRIEGVRLALEVDRQELAIDGRIRVIMQLDVAPGRVAALPDLPDRVGRFAVAAQSPAESSSEGGALVLRRHYDLEPESVGALTVPPFVIAVRDRQGGDDTVQEIRTDPVPITVTSVVPDGVDYTEPKDIAPPMSLPPPAWPIALWAVLGAVAAAIAAGVAVVAASAPTGGGGATAAGAPARAGRTRSPAAGRVPRRGPLRGLLRAALGDPAPLPGLAFRSARADADNRRVRCRPVGRGAGLDPIPRRVGNAARRASIWSNSRATGRSAATWRRRSGASGSSSSAPPTSRCWSIRPRRIGHETGRSAGSAASVAGAAAAVVGQPRPDAGRARLSCAGRARGPAAVVARAVAPRPALAARCGADPRDHRARAAAVGGRSDQGPARGHRDRHGGRRLDQHGRSRPAAQRQPGDAPGRGEGGLPRFRHRRRRRPCRPRRRHHRHDHLRALCGRAEPAHPGPPRPARPARSGRDHRAARGGRHRDRRRHGAGDRAAARGRGGEQGDDPAHRRQPQRRRRRAAPGGADRKRARDQNLYHRRRYARHRPDADARSGRHASTMRRPRCSSTSSRSSASPK